MKRERWRIDCDEFTSTRSSAASASSRKKEQKTTTVSCFAASLDRSRGLRANFFSDEGSHMPLGCVPFCRAQLASTHPCNYLYSICVQGIVRSMVALHNYGGNNKTAAVITMICKLHQAAHFLFLLRGR